MSKKSTYKPIGIFDSGFGGLTVLKEIVKEMPQYDYLYLGDNARAPYGSRSFETVYEYTLECVNHLFNMGCELVVLACNTASAKALRTIQQKDLPRIGPNKRVLGVIRPTTEIIGNHTKSGNVGVLGTAGTVSSGSYLVEIEKFFPNIHVYQEACPMWVPLIENNEHQSEGAEYFIKKHVEHLMQQQPNIDAIILGCTHYPLIIDKIKKYLPDNVQLLSQGTIVAKGLKEYLHRHPEMEINCSKSGIVSFYTTDLTATFDKSATLFYGKEVKSKHLAL
ncbi:glutamate racemase [Sediminibacterium sp.]|uniref:glutamate racemase n=1 Tax=Sediminibacterium sp. TaxID=1917865 RepID=UPI00271DD596|nr:glutamate racemase [Sediminibacterium sp.]MDO9000544.1 glutamate racemase [Bacteroidota bacterium]MDP3146888.1 glutamate racemase [Bacteroidota bacterium]MDP3567573.1 glutamate racemase [Sediminibacterium sp.]